MTNKYPLRVMLAFLLALSIVLTGCAELPPSVSDTTIPTTVSDRTETTTGLSTTATTTVETTATSTTVETTTETTTGKPTTELSMPLDKIDAGGLLASIPAFDGETPYIAINGNEPFFLENKDQYLTTTSYEYYSELDDLERCGVTVACVGQDIMPTEERGSIGSVKPSGWHTVKYDIVSGKYLYNRCHLIGYQLTAENANTKNLITGTRYLNIEGMLPFENMVADYVKETGNHVLLKVTPIFVGDNLLASGVVMEAYSVEDDGDGICFNVYCYNAQPGIEIDYICQYFQRKTNIFIPIKIGAVFYTIFLLSQRL